MWTVTNRSDVDHHVPLAGVTLAPGEAVDVDDRDLVRALDANGAFTIDPPLGDEPEPECDPTLEEQQ